MVLRGDGTALAGSVVVDRAHQCAAGLALKLDQYARDAFIFVEGQYDPALDEIEIAVEAAGIFELDLDGHGQALVVSLPAQRSGLGRVTGCF